MPQPITADENDPNIDWDSQSGVSMPSPYNGNYLNEVTAASLPSLVQLQTYYPGMDATARTFHHRFVHING